MTSKYVIEKLTKAKRKYKVVDEERSAELFCVKCDKPLGLHDLIYESLESIKYCSECVKKFIKPTPVYVSKNLTVLEDYGDDIVIRYENIRQEEHKQCYFTSKGRFIKVKGKRLYI